jgi:hypothetical protein
MGSWGRAVAGLVLMVGAVAVIAFSIWKLTRIGTCASGGPYEVARGCPAGTELYGLGIFLSVYAFLLGGWMFATRGRLRGVKPGLPPAGGDYLSNPHIGRS